MRVGRGLAAIGAMIGLGLAGPAIAAGNLAAKGIYLPELQINTTDLSYSQDEYDLETGVYYHLTVSADDADSVSFLAPELWRNSWIDQVAVDEVQIKPMGLYSLDFDGAGSFTITFVPIRPGVYEFWAPGFESRGLKGKFVVN